MSGEDEGVREKAIEYVSTALMSMRHILFIPHPENEKHLVTHIKKVRRLYTASLLQQLASPLPPSLSSSLSLFLFSSLLSRLFSSLRSLPLPYYPASPQVLVDVTGEEFEVFMEMLSKLQFLSTGKFYLFLYDSYTMCMYNLVPRVERFARSRVGIWHAAILCVILRIRVKSLGFACVCVKARSDGITRDLACI